MDQEKESRPKTFMDLKPEVRRNWALQQETQLFLAELRRDREHTNERLLAACLPIGEGAREHRVAYRAEIGIYDMITVAIESALGVANG